MRRENVETVMNHVDQKYIQEAGEFNMKGNMGVHTNRMVKKVAVLAALLGLCVVVSVPALAAAGVQPAYEILYQIFPETAQKLKQVNVSCEDNGIKMEVVSANVHGDTADVYISMQDVTGNRIDETIDLFDSYDIKPSFDSVGTCTFVNYDNTKNIATFLIQIKQCDKKTISGSKMTFSVREFLSGKKEYHEGLPKSILEHASENPAIQSDMEIRGESGNVDSTKNMLKADEKNAYSPIDGVMVTSAGFVDGKLHVQVHYENILETDNHGEVYLVDNKNDTVECESTVAFWDEEEIGSYEEYIFDISPETDLEEYELYGDFVTCNSLTAGNWEVTFPLENVN